MEKSNSQIQNYILLRIRYNHINIIINYVGRPIPSIVIPTLVGNFFDNFSRKVVHLLIEIFLVYFNVYLFFKLNKNII